MDKQPLLSIITITITIALLLIKHTKNKRQNLPPSPPSLPIIGHLHLLKKPLHRTLAALADRYGPVLLLRFGSRPVLVVSSPSAANECFTTNDITFANRPNLPSFKDFSYNYTTMGSLRYGPLWRDFRRIATVDVLSNHRILSLSDVRADEVRQLTRLLLKQYAVFDKDESGFARVEIKPRVFELGMNIMMRMIAGKRYYGEGMEMSSEATRFRRIMKESVELLQFSNPGDFLPVLRWLGFRGVEKKLKVLHGVRDELLQGFIDEHRREEGDGGDGKKTMIGNLLELQKMDPDQKNTDTVIKALIISLLQAGTSTTSDTIEWAMSLLLNNPITIKKLRAEIDENVGNERLIDETDIAHLSYLQCVINETLRLQPATPLLLPHESSEDCRLKNYNIPRETMLMVNIYAIQRDPAVWKEPLKFEPERFEEKDKFIEENIIRWMIPFGMGRRKCLGEGLAIRVVGLTLGMLVQCFEWDRVNNKEVDLSEASGIAMSKLVPLEAMYCPRSVMSAMLSKLL